MTRSSSIVVAGGAGYIGRCTAHQLKSQGWEPVVLDDYSTSQERTEAWECHKLNLCDEAAVRAAFQKIVSKHGEIGGLIHFAARALVSESCQSPGLYFRNNTLSTINLSEVAVEFSVPAFVYSSSCSIYGIPKAVPIGEQAPKNPFSPYGESKWMGENILRQYQSYKKLNCVALRYFNPAGAIGDLGEAHEPETHLIPNVIRAADRGEPVKVFGNQYPTSDGTCVRDFIHIADLVEAHIRALDYLTANPGFHCFNVGAGEGKSVLEVIKATEGVLKKQIAINIEPPRLGDPPVLIANITLAKDKLQWQPRKNLNEILRDHYHWYQRQSN